MGDVTKNFSWGELSIVPHTALPISVRGNLLLIIQRLQVVRDLLDRPIHITSGYRTPEHNTRVGGRPNSFHIYGKAVDIVVSGMSAKAVQAYLKNWSGGMGCYNSFTHLDIGPERRW